jgi:HJR/Mrr/RecB family endonuclease
MLLNKKIRYAANIMNIITNNKFYDEHKNFKYINYKIKL